MLHEEQTVKGKVKQGNLPGTTAGVQRSDLGGLDKNGGYRKMRKGQVFI